MVRRVTSRHRRVAPVGALVADVLDAGAALVDSGASCGALCGERVDLVGFADINPGASKWLPTHGAEVVVDTY